MKGVQILMMGGNKGKGYGYLYNQYAISHANFAPPRWHVPTTSEIITLLSYLGGSSVAGGKLKETGFDHWKSPNTGATNSSGFTAFGGGRRRGDNGTFFGFNYFGYYGYNSGDSILELFYNDEYNGAIGDPKAGMSIRLIRDTGAGDLTPSTITDIDGNIYDTIIIGTQIWLKQNWKCTKLNDGTSLTKVTSNSTWISAGTGDLYYCAYNNNDGYV